MRSEGCVKTESVLRDGLKQQDGDRDTSDMFCWGLQDAKPRMAR